MSGRVKFLKSGMTLTAVGLALKTVGMLFGAFVTRAVGAEGVGLYTVVMTVYSFAVTFATSGISLTVTRLVAGAVGEGRESELGGLLRAAVLYSLTFGAVATAFLFLGSELLGSVVLSDGRVASSLKILSLSLIPVALCSVFSGYFVGVKRVGFNAVVQVMSQIFKVILTFVLVTRLSEGGVVMSVIALCLGITLTEIVALLLIFTEFLVDRHRHGRRGGEAKKQLGGVIGAALPLAVSAYARSILTTVEHILIPRRLIGRGEDNSEAYAHYGTLHGMALPLVLYPMSPLTSFSGLLVPEFAEDAAGRRFRRMERIASEALNTTMIYSALAAVFLFYFSEDLGYAVYNSFEAGRFIAVLALIVPIMYLDHVTDGILKGIGEQVYSMWVNITDSLISVVLVYFLIPPLGILGYAVVIVIMEGYNFVMSALRLKKRIRIRVDLIGSALLPAIAAIISAAITDRLFLFSGRGVEPIWLTLKILFATAIFVSAVVILRRLLNAMRSRRGIHREMSENK